MHLALPANLSEGRNTSLDNGATAPTRYQSAEQILPDENTGRDEKPIKVGRKNLQFARRGREFTDQLVSLPVIRIVRDGSGRFEVDQSFVPPCLSISASLYFTGMLRRLIDILDDKSAVSAASSSSARWSI